MTILVTGASGHLGRLTVTALLARGTSASDIVAGARDTAKLAELVAQGVRTVHLDYDDAASITAAVEGVDVVVLVSGLDMAKRVAQHTAVAEAAHAVGARIVYTSAPKADSTDLILAPDHKATEEAIAALGIPATILRNNWYHENYLGTRDQADATGELVSSWGDGVVASAARADYAEAAAVVATTDGHVGVTYELGGDTAWGAEEFAATLSDVLGKPIALRRVTADEERAELLAAGLDEGTAGFVTAMDANIAAGDLAEVTGDLSRLLGRPTTPLAAGLAR